MAGGERACPSKRETLFSASRTRFREKGKATGYVRVPYSSDLSAYGFIAVPIAVVGQGDGPTALLMAGSQGRRVRRPDRSRPYRAEI